MMRGVAIVMCAAMAVVGCGGGKLAPQGELTEGAPGPAPLAPETALVLRDEALVALDERGELVGSWSLPGAYWCAPDARAGVIWMMAHSDKGATLWALTPEPSAKPVEIARGLPPTPAEIIYPDGARVAQLDGADFDVAAALMLGAGDAAPRLEPLVGCNNSMSSYMCYESDPNGGGPLMGADGAPALTADLEQQREQVRAAQIVNAAHLKALVARGGARPTWSSVEPTAQGVVEGLDLSAQICEGPEVCGEAVSLTNTPYWLVITSSSMGDLPHNERQIYDPQRKVFAMPAALDTTSATPLADPAAQLFDARIIVSPSGRRMLTWSHIFELGRAARHANGLTCGFMGPGALIPPR